MCLAGYARSIDLKSKSTIGMDAAAKATCLGKSVPPEEKWSLMRDNGQTVLVPTVAGLAAAAGSCGVQSGMHNLFCCHSIEKEPVDDKGST